MVQGGASQEACHVSQRPTHLLCPAAEQGGTDLHRAAAQVPFGHRVHEHLCRPAQQDQGQGGKKTADDYMLIGVSPKKSCTFAKSKNENVSPMRSDNVATFPLVNPMKLRILI